MIYIYIYFSIITLYTKNVKQIGNTINSAPITIYVVERKLNVKKKKVKKKKKREKLKKKYLGGRISAIFHRK